MFSSSTCLPWLLVSTAVTSLPHAACKFIDIPVSAMSAETTSGVDVSNDLDDKNQHYQKSSTTATTTSIQPTDAGQNKDVAQRQVDWVLGNGGFVSDKLELRQLNKLDFEKYDVSHTTIPHAKIPTYAWFAASDISPQELLFSIPRECIITSELTEENPFALSPHMECEVARNLYRELQFSSSSTHNDKNASHYQPYLDYIKATQPSGQLPSSWSSAGKSLLWSIVGGTSEFDQRLPPLGPTDWINYEWIQECGGDPENENEHYAALLTVQRVLGSNGGGLLIPLYDMLNHRNAPEYQEGNNINDHNTVISSHSLYDGDVQVRSSRTIRAGEMLYTSYNLCRHCGKERTAKYGTAEIFRDYGFVEKYPQKWILEEQEIQFTIDWTYGLLEDDTLVPLLDDPLQITSVSEGITNEDLFFVVDELARLDGLPLDHLRANVPSLEWDVAMDYHHAVLVALETLRDTLEWMQCENRNDGDDSTCQLSTSQFNPLDALVSDSHFNMEACNRRVSMDFSRYENMDKIQSHYQSLTFDKDPANDDVCFDLDAIVQICGSYRPHYHEYAVHYAARYLKEIKRVLWVGGGDSMLLHEILKYPTLEIAIGLELDQKVTRYSFKHFGTQPHFDNEKVTWWYGDAAKSMLMLPKQYFGTFDLVLVDLSETVMSMTVTKDLDILGALSLLVKPDGIFVKNEMYLDKLAGIFNHTILLDYDDVPVLCSQSMCLGSNQIDFLHAELTEHNIDPIMDTMKQIDDYHYKIINDSVRNETSSSFCSKDDDETEPEEQTSSPGVVTILEAEDASIDLSSPEHVKGLIVAVVMTEGLSVVSATISMQDRGALMTVVLKEGYVVARTWPQHHYCAFDLHFWSRFEKQDRLEKSLLAAVGSSTSSSFRIVAGGMFGVDTWKTDQRTRGPRFTDECDEVVTTSRTEVMDETLLDTIVEATLQMMPWANVSAAVICGTNKEECHGIDQVKSDRRVDVVIPILTCSGVEGGVGFYENPEELLLGCEREVIHTLTSGLGPERAVGLLVLDPSASFEMAQIFNKVATNKNEYNKEYLMPDLMAIAPVKNPDERWRSIFMDQFRLLYYKPFTFRSEVLFNSTESSIEMGTFLSGSERFIMNLNSVNQDIESRTGLAAEVRHIHGGTGTYAEVYEPSQFSLPGDYDQLGPYEQWRSQTPTGLQTIIQMVGGQGLSSKKVKSLLEHSLAAENLVLGAPIHDFETPGDGSVAEFSWNGGHAIVLWDGRDHIGVNLFTYEDDATLANRLVEHITKNEPLFTVALLDEMPRGYGRVVLYSRDLEKPGDPHWAKSVATS